MVGGMAVTITWTPATAATAVVLELAPPSVDFGAVPVGEARHRDMKVTNESDENVTIDTTSTTRTEFTVVRDECTGEVVTPGESCVFGIEFRPTATAAFSGTVRVGASTAGGEQGTVSGSLVGRGTATTTSTTAVTSTQRPPLSTVPLTTPAPTTSVAGGPDDRQQLAECERRAETANVFYPPRLDMKVGEVSQVHVVASLDAGASPLTTVSPVPTTAQPARLRCEVQARLRGSGVTIEPDGFQQRSFLDHPEVSWEWDVVSNEAGRRRLVIEIRSVAEIDGRRIEGAGTQLYRTDIVVTSPPESLSARTRRWTDALVEHPLVRGFGSLALVAGGAAGAWRWLLKRRWPWSRAASTAPSPAEASSGEATSVEATSVEDDPPG